MKSHADTIAAIATATGGGIGIVRVSGAQASSIGERVLRPFPSTIAPRVLLHGEVVDGDELIDEVLFVLFRGPRSYTGEDVLEIHAHGGAAGLARVLSATVKAGARVAEPGEFTRRAFLAGRLDLTRAEAVADLIAARDERAARVARAQLGGGVERTVRSLLAPIVNLLAEIEGSIDFPEEDVEVAAIAEQARVVVECGAAIARLASSYARGRLLVEGIDVVLAGRPNAGKSSLVNALAGEERALVDAAPGTTRDVVEVEVDLGGVRARLVDTAGERQSEAGTVEQRGMELGRRRRNLADIVMLVIDGSVGWTATEDKLLAEAGERALIVWNKCDLAPSTDPRAIAVAATRATGLDALRAALLARFVDVSEEATITLTSERQHAALVSAQAALARALPLLDGTRAPELVAMELRTARESLREVLGETATTEVLDRVFARFCIGK